MAQKHFDHFTERGRQGQGQDGGGDGDRDKEREDFLLLFNKMQI